METELEKQAKAAYYKTAQNHPTIHCNRFPTWEELSLANRNGWIQKMKKEFAEVEFTLNEEQTNALFLLLCKDAKSGINLKYMIHNSGEGLYAWTKEEDADTPYLIAGPDCKV